MGWSGLSVRSVAGYLAGISLGTMSITLLFLGMRAVMDVGGACADGGPYVTAQPCPDGVPLAMVGGMFGLFGAAGLIVWFGSRIGGAAAALVAIGWPALFLVLGFNFLDYAFHPPDGEPTPVWGWLIPGVIFWVMGGAPLAVGLAAWRETRAGRPGNRLSRQVVAGVRLRPNTLAARALAEDPGLIPDRDAGPAESIVPARAPRSGDDRSGGMVRIGPAATARPVEAPDPLVEDLVRLAELHAAGELTDAEFAAAKRERLDAVEPA